MAQIIRHSRSNRGRRLLLASQSRIPRATLRYVLHKGSFVIEGISLNSLNIEDRSSIPFAIIIITQIMTNLFFEAPATPVATSKSTMIASNLKK